MAVPDGSGVLAETFCQDPHVPIGFPLCLAIVVPDDPGHPPGVGCPEGLSLPFVDATKWTFGNVVEVSERKKKARSGTPNVGRGRVHVRPFHGTWAFFRLLSLRFRGCHPSGQPLSKVLSCREYVSYSVMILMRPWDSR